MKRVLVSSVVLLLLGVHTAQAQQTTPCRVLCTPEFKIEHTITFTNLFGLSGVRGKLIAATQSGRVSLQGVPRRDWVASAGSGSVDISTESTVPFTIDASSGSGSVKVIGATVQGSVSKRKVLGHCFSRAHTPR